MIEQSAANLSVFDLLAMSWTLEEEIARSEVSSDGQHSIFQQASGKLAIMRTSDAESPARRMTIDKESGRTTIRPRTTPPMPPVRSGILTRPDLPVVRFGTGDFAAVSESGAVCQVTARGQVLERLSNEGGPATAFCGDLSGSRLALAREKDLLIFDVASAEVAASVQLRHCVSCLAMDPNGSRVVAWGENSVSIVDWSQKEADIKTFACEGDVVDMSWSSSASHVACGSVDNTMLIIDCSTKQIQRVEGFPGAVRCVAFSEPGHALVASGAFRLVAWAEDDLPLKDEPGTSLVSGKTGFVVIDRIAAHPTRGLVASGYANGLISVTGIGTPDELILRKRSSAAVTALRWSPDGTHLIVGDAGGDCSIVTLPEKMFK
ncbi:WD40 repeat domain-containing protein [Roseibium marinum]|uniref:WD domain G-beta repeat uncharacterized protein n=1 Tax=Roseibium marinum TaxID=281252 RepID=A0A2S3UT70_9HYPH|nr:hypothetical protein [Roseibium marinum]POF30854.1 WD domain G-beta repeat uncharacterized protein [Roseibium marinum]